MTKSIIAFRQNLTNRLFGFKKFTGKKITSICTNTKARTPHFEVLEPRTLLASDVLVARGSIWKYLDDGSNQGTAWRASAFDDSSWRSGRAEFGYGDADEMTTVGYIDTSGASGVQKNATTYFRTSFTLDVDDEYYDSLKLRLRYDDAAAVYLNGQPLLRTSNLSTDAEYDDFATGPTPNENIYQIHSGLNAGLLVPGVNVLAVEIHQDSDNSSDISFDLALLGKIRSELDVVRSPYLQLGNAPISGYYNSTEHGALDQAVVMWQTIPSPLKQTGDDDQFQFQYRKIGDTSWTGVTVQAEMIDADTSEVWDTLGAEEYAAGVRKNWLAPLPNLDWATYYEYEVVQTTDVTETPGPIAVWKGKFLTRQKGGINANLVDRSNFLFVAYGDSTDTDPVDVDRFMAVQRMINELDERSDVDIAFSLLLGDNTYGDTPTVDDGSHYTIDYRFDPSKDGSLAEFNSNHIEFLGWGNHETRETGGGSAWYTNMHDGTATVETYSLPTPVSGANSPATFGSLDSRLHERVYSYDYGIVHFAHIDTNMRDNTNPTYGGGALLDAQLAWLEADLEASNAIWKIVYFHHPLVDNNSLRDESNGTADRYYNLVESSDNEYDAILAKLEDKIDLLLVGDIHNYQRSYALTGRSGTTPTFTTQSSRTNDYLSRVGVPHVIVGTGGAAMENVGTAGSHLAASYGTDASAIPAQFGFLKIDVSPEKLEAQYIGTGRGQSGNLPTGRGEILDFFTIHKSSSTLPSSGNISLHTDTQLISFGSTGWDYFNSNSSNPVDGTWKSAVSYSDSGWTKDSPTTPTQDGPFGYGTIAGVSSFGTSVNNGGGNPTTNYYRKVFNVADPGRIASLQLEMLFDDGAVVYLNGVEIQRTNLFDGNVIPATTAAVSRSSSPNTEGMKSRFLIDAQHLKFGNNVIAVEVHQASDTEADHVFDLQLTAKTIDESDYGDFNNDGDIDSLDVDMLLNEIQGAGTRPVFDMNRDGRINIGDLILLTLDYDDSVDLFEIIADYDSDDDVDWDDLEILRSGIAASPQPPGLDLDGNQVQDERDLRVLALFLADFDHDADFDLDDMQLLLTAIISTSTPSLYDVNRDSYVNIHDRDMLLFDLLDADFDDDDIIDASDINALVASLIGSSYAAAHDLNMDGRVDADDLNMLIRVILMTEFGDSNLDGNVSLGDLVLLAENFNVTTGMGWQHGNFSEDTGATLGDLVILAEHYGFTGDGGSLERGDATWGLAAQALTAGVDTEFTVSEGEDVGDDLMRYLISLSVDEGVGLISGLTIQIEATDEGTLNQVNEAFGGSFTTIFEDNNLIISYDPNAAPIEQDSQFAWMTNELSMIMQNLENADMIMASFILAQATAFFQTVVAQVVLAAGHSATVSGTIVAEDGTQIILDPVTFGGEE